MPVGPKPTSLSLPRSVVFHNSTNNNELLNGNLLAVTGPAEKEGCSLKRIHYLFVLSIVLFAANLQAQQPAAPSAAAAQSKRASDYLNQDMPRWFRINGEYRVRFEGIGGGSYRPNATDAFVLGRLRLNTTFIPTTWMKLTLQGQDAQVTIDLHTVGVDDAGAAMGCEPVGEPQRQRRLAAGGGSGYQDRPSHVRRRLITAASLSARARPV